MKSKNARKPGAKTPAKSTERTLTKLDQVEGLLRRPEGASILDLTSATGWQQHSVRGALAGALRKRGHKVTSQKVDGVRRYAIAAEA